MAKLLSSSPKRSQEPTQTDGAGNHNPNETRLDLPLISLALDRHEFECPHCQERTVRLWPGCTILFATVTCTHCGLEFLVVQNKLWPEPHPAPEEKHVFSAMPVGGVPGQPAIRGKIA